MFKRWNSSKEALLEQINQYDIVSFDMFNTLVTTPGVKLDDNIFLLSNWVKQNYNTKLDFYKIWFKAVNVIKAKDKNYTLDDVYTQIKKFKIFTTQQLKSIKKHQIKSDINGCFPKKDMLQIFNHLVKANKKIFIISDMYYPSYILNKILHKCGYYHYEKIIVSCELKKSKSSSKLWKYYFKSVDKKKAIHIGDNYFSDFKTLKKYGKNAILIKTSKQYTSNIKFLKIKANLSAQNRMMYGLILNKQLFNSPFNKFDAKKFNSYDFGYSILGPLFFSFFNKALKNAKFSKLLFVSREGYYFQKIYKNFNRIFLKTSEIPNVYLLSSRQVSTLSNIQSFDDILWVCKFSVFQGWTKDFFLNRFNVLINEDDNLRVRKGQSYKLCKLSHKYKQQILKQSNIARTRYKKYLQQHVTNNSCLMDVGYSGTSQYFISKILNKRIYGMYFWLRFTRGSSSFKSNKKNMFSVQPYFKHKVLMHWSFGDIVECFLTAPYGQFAGFDSCGHPMYKNDVLSKKSFEYRDLAFKGIIDLFKDIKRYSIFDFNKEIIDSTIAYDNLLSFYWYFKRKNVSHELETMLKKYDLFRGITKVK